MPGDDQDRATYVRAVSTTGNRSSVTFVAPRTAIGGGHLELTPVPHHNHQASP